MATRSLASFSLDPTGLSATASIRFLQLVVHNRVGRRVFWGFTVALYAATGLFCLIAALVYWVAWRYRDGYILDYIGALPLQYIPLVIACYAVIGGLFYWTLARVLLASCRARRLVFSSPGRSAVSPTVDAPSKEDAELVLRTTEKPDGRWCWCWSWYRRLPRARWLRQLDDSSRFEVEYVLRELLEISLQTQQCYKSSWLLASAGLNRFYVTVLVLNCWLVPLLSVMLHEQHLAKRLALLATDAALDFSGTIVLPLLLVQAIVFRPASYRTRAVYLFDVPLDDDVLVDLILSTQQVAMMNWVDVFAKLLPLLSILGSLRKMHSAMVLASFVPLAPAPPSASAPAASARPLRRASVTLRAVLAKPLGLFTRGMHVSLRLTRLVFLLWGVLVVSLHAAANAREASAAPAIRMGCKAAVRPWLVQRFACSVLEIDCVQHGIAGTARELDAVLSRLEPTTVSSLIISHCMSLSVPPSVQRLHNLLGFEITNASLVAWGADAAFHDANHPTLHYLSLVRMNLSAIPAGLLSPSFPRGLRDLHIVATQLDALPTELHHVWRDPINLYLERNALREVPETVLRMKSLERLSFFGNDLAVVPAELFADGSSLGVASFARNPRLQDVPAATDLPKALLLDGTNVSSVPSWLRDAAEKGAYVSLGGTPFCAQSPAPAAALSEADDIHAALHGGVSCRVKPENEVEAYAFAQNLRDRVARPALEL
ncbi:hypothetical protein P43SY_005317 [Pythium insidiosum]|uniref:TKL protein kinase n=1 Tax=Pythium insidiosum TaxID=114742 RepID=A0AAD5M736_PYTIN|nr:hypothetical protein P43SY_005317 [Pythium insidiosum]